MKRKGKLDAGEILFILLCLVVVFLAGVKTATYFVLEPWQHIDVYEVGDDHYPHSFNVYRSLDGKRIKFVEVDE